MSRVVLVEHPLIQHKLSLLRDKETNIKEFRELTEEISTMLGYEATRDIPLKSVEIETPIANAKTQVIAGQKVGLIPILRAGLGMVSGLQRLVPNARVGHIGVYREPEMFDSVEYFSKLPTDVQDRDLYVMDVMMATGGNAVAAVNILKKNHATKIKMICLIASPEGIAELQRVHDDVDIFVACIDEKLNEKGYIVPGLGDAGDRLFGTK